MSTLTDNDIRGLLREIDLPSIDIDGLDPDRPLTEQGLDSLDMMNLLFQIEERYGVSYDEETMKPEQWRTLSRIAKNVNDLK